MLQPCSADLISWLCESKDTESMVFLVALHIDWLVKSELVFLWKFPPPQNTELKKDSTPKKTPQAT